MKTVKTHVLTTSIATAIVAVMTGCSTPKIPVTMNAAGEIKLTGVSKIALVDFNTLPTDPFTGKVAADSETRALVQRTVASAFYKTPTYQIANLSAEQAIANVSKALPDKRFDAIVYGCLWWQIMPETDGEYPAKYTLDSWQNIPYHQKVFGKKIPAIAKVTTQKKDVVQLLKYRTQSASLMLALAFYRVDGNGNISKIVDVYQVAEQGFTLMNGKIKIDVVDIGMKNDGAAQRLQKTGNDRMTTTAFEDMFEGQSGLLGGAGGGTAADAAGQAVGGALGGALGGFGGLGRSLGGAVVNTSAKKTEVLEKPAKKAKVDANGKIILLQESVTMPTVLQAKLMLAARLSGDIAARVAPSEITFEADWDDFDNRLTELVRNRAWAATQVYAAYMIRRTIGKELSEKIAAIEDIVETYPIAASEESFDADETEDMMEYFASEKIDVYLYALGLALEATGKTYEALDMYTEAFSINPTKETALGISRCNMAIGQNKRLNETKKAKKQAEKKTRLD